MVDVIVVSLRVRERLVPFDLENVLNAMLGSSWSIYNCAIVRLNACYQVVGQAAVIARSFERLSN